MKTKFNIIISVLFIIQSTNVIKAQDYDKAVKYYKYGLYNKASIEFEKALPNVKAKHGENDTYVMALVYTALSFQNAIKYKKAEQYYQQCINLLEKNNKQQGAWYATCCSNFGGLYETLGKYKKAEDLYFKAKKIYRNIRGKTHNTYATVCNNIAGLYLKTGKYKEAEQLFIETKKIYEKVYGKTHERYALICNNLGELYRKQGKYKEAEPLMIESKKINEKKLGKGSISYADNCNNLAILYLKIGQYVKSEPLFEEALNVYNKKYDKEHPSYVKCINNLAVLYKEIGKYKKALPLYLDSKEKRAKLYGKEHPDYAISCNNLAELYREMSNYSKAETQYIEAKNIFEKKYGKKHSSYATSCNNLAVLYRNMGLYFKAKPLNIEAKKIRAANSGKKSIDYAESCNNLATLYMNMGNYQIAKSLFLEAKSIFENKYGKKHSSYAASCGNLAVLYNEMGNFNKAEAYYIEAKEIEKEILGPFHKSYAKSCNNLSTLYLEMGNIREAFFFSTKANLIYRSIFGKEHTSYAKSCNNLARIYSKIKEYSEAEKLYMQAFKINLKKYGKEHPNYANSCNSLAILYANKGDFSKSIALHTEAKKVREKVLGKEHPDYATSCNNLANLLANMGEFSKAIALYLEAKKIYQKAFGEKHPKYSMVCNNLAVLYAAIGKDSKTEALYLEANSVITGFLQESAKYMNEKEREKYLKSNITTRFEAYHSFFLTKRKKNIKLPGIVYNNSLNIKGQLLKSTITVRKAILQSGNKKLIESYNEMNAYAKILVKQYNIPISEQRRDIFEIEGKLHKLEKKIIRYTSNLPSVKNFTDKVNWQDIQNSLKNDEVAIEFIKFRHRNNTRCTDSTLYYALLLRKDYKYPKAVFLFEEKQLQKLLEREEYENDFNYVKRLYSPSSVQSDSLFNLTFKPLEVYLKDAKTLYVSPTGLMNSVALDAIPTKEKGNPKSLLSDKYRVFYTSSTASIINRTSLYQKDIKNTVLFGGIEYSLSPEDMKKLSGYLNKDTEEVKSINEKWANNNRNLIDSLSRNVSWSYLPGSLKEAEEIQNVLKDKKFEVKLYKEKQGSEEQFKALEKDAPSILHVSTHGFYFGDDKKSKEYKLMIDDKVKFAHSKNPLLRSGFILAGGNLAFQGKEIPKGVEDGVLTAAEISSLNFFNTKLVVLSACQTGLGDVKGSEGVYGLQRAFKMAGVEYLLFSLWEVPDYQTKELMTNFYKNWFSGMEIREAFKKTQNQLKTKYAKVEGAAFAWAAFVLMR